MRERLTSPSNPRVKNALQLRNGGSRRKQSKFLIDGQREIELAIRSGVRVLQVFTTDSLASTTFLEAGNDPVEVLTISTEIADRLSYGQRGAEPVAVAETPKLSLSNLKWSSDTLVLVLDRSEKPGNIGACLRTAAACHASVVLTDPICEVFNPNLIRASRGSVFTTPLAVCTAGQLQAECARQEIPLQCARIDGSRRLWDLNLRRGQCLVFGNEAEGLDVQRWPLTSQRPQIDSFSIPMSNKNASGVDSLNLSTSAAVTLYEALRQRECTG